MQRAYWLATVAALAALAYPALAQPAAPAKPAAPAAKPPTTVKEITVEGAPPPVRTSIDRQSYSVSGDLQATTGTISDALRNVPSVEVDVQGNVSLRGDPNVTIMIDGKPSGRFRGEGKAQALQSLPANQIERVEVITNPSAAFSPDGSAGVINLITKKNVRPGVTGSVRANVGSGDRQNGGASVTRREGRFTTSADLYLRRDSQRNTNTGERTFFDPVRSNGAFERREGRARGEVNVAGLRGEVNFDPDAKTRWSAELDYNGVQFANTNHDVLNRFGPAGDLRVGQDTVVENRQDRDNLELTLSYRKKWGDDHELTARFVRELNDEDRGRPLLRSFRVPSLPTTFEDYRFRNRFWRTQGKLEYARPLGEARKLKVGYEFTADDNDYDLKFLRGPPAGPIVLDPARSNLFLFDQQVHALYGTYETPLGKTLTALAGLRAEATQIDLNQATQGLKDENDYVRFYPSLHLNYRLGETQVLTASYSHRVQRPTPQDYNAFRIIFDPQNQYQGNPDLKPQQTDSFELGYQYRKQGTILLATGYYRRGRDAVNDVFRELPGGAILQTKANVGRFQSAGVELVANGRLPGKIQYNVSGNLYWSEIDATSLGFGSGVRSAYTAQGRAALNWTATDRDFFQLQGQVNGKRLLSQGFAEPFAIVNLGYRRKFSDQLSGVITAQDAFDTFRFRSQVTTSSYFEVNRGKPQNRAVFVGLTYTFGGARQRDPGFDFGGGGPPS